MQLIKSVKEFREMCDWAFGKAQLFEDNDVGHLYDLLDIPVGTGDEETVLLSEEETDAFAWAVLLKGHWEEFGPIE